jgi:hypothetical protein
LSLRLRSGTSANSPGFFGKTSDGPEVYLPNPYYDSLNMLGIPDNINHRELLNFTLPQGSGIPVMIVPSAQLNIGVYKNTDICFRFIPSIDFVNDFKISLWGIGIIHDIKQWIPLAKELPFDLAFQFAYTRLKMSYDFGKNGLKPEIGSVYADGSQPVSTRYHDQHFTFESQAWNTNLIVSKKISFFTPYANLGWQGWNTDMVLMGTYPLVNSVYINVNDLLDPNNGKLITGDYTDPLSVSAKRNAPVAGLGFRLKFSVFTFHAHYTLSDYSAASAGIGISFGEN